MARKPKPPLRVETVTHDEASRTNIPTAELQPVMAADDLDPRTVRYGRNRDLDPQLMWRGKDERDWSDLVVTAPPLFIQEKVHPKVLIDDLMQRSKERKDAAADDAMPDLFADFNGIAPDVATEFYQHEQNWTNRMILGDSLQVMASLAEREGLRGKVQCIYFDPPYGIRFNSNFQWSTTTRDVKDGKADHITREPEQVRAFRDTWRDGIHSYLTYLRDRLTIARDLLTDSGSIFVQIGDENVHRVRAVMDEVFGEGNLCSQITVTKTANQTSELIAGTADYLLWYSNNREKIKFRNPYRDKNLSTDRSGVYRWVRHADGISERLSEDNSDSDRIFRYDNLLSQRPPGDFPVNARGRVYRPGRGYWKTGNDGMRRLLESDRIGFAKNSLTYIRYLSDFAAQAVGNVWSDTGTGSFTEDKLYVVQTAEKIVQRCILMATDPGDLVLDPTCGSGTTATVAEQWGRRWITIDTSRVALALSRARIMGARYPYYLLSDSREGQRQEAEIARTPPADSPTRGDIRHGFVYDRVPHITLKSIANNAEIDVIWDHYQETLEPLRAKLNAALEKSWEEWDIPREDGDPWPAEAQEAFAILRQSQAGKQASQVQQCLSRINQALDRAYRLDDLPDRPRDPWPQAATDAHAAWWDARIARQKKIDAAIAARADQEYLYDRPYEDKSRVRVAGPFTVESLSPHRILPVDADDEIIGLAGPGNRGAAMAGGGRSPASADTADFAAMIIENLKAAGVQQQKKDDRIIFSSVTGWPGELIAAEGRYREETDAHDRRAAIFIGPEYGTVTRADLTRAAREAAEAGFDILVSCAFNYDAQSTEVGKLGRIQILKARMNPDLHMAGDLKAASGGNLFIVFGEPDIDILTEADGRIRVKIHGVDVFRPGSGEIDSGGTDDIAMWFIDTSYNDESFFVRHAYFLGAGDPYKSLKTTLKAEIDAEAWASLYSDTSRPFDRPATGRIAVKIINHLGDEVMKVFAV